MVSITTEASRRLSSPGGRRRRGRAPLGLGLLVLVLVSGCATLRQVRALQHVAFSLTGASESTLAGVPIESTRSFDDLSTLQVARLAAALAQGTLPFKTVLQVRASNPSDNVQARLLKLDWTLFLNDQKTVSGKLDQEYVLPPGEPVTVPVPVQLDLLEFFNDNLQQLVDLALAATGEGGPQKIRLEATPSIQTPLGPIRYPEPIRIEQTVGG